MPSDLSIRPSRRLVRVRDRAGVGLPFSKGIMATSILATGLPTDEAYSIAADIERALQDRQLDRIEADELAGIAGAAIDRAAGAACSERYVAWRRVKRTGQPLVVCLSGAPGVGKSALATRLALRLGVNHVVTTDAIREVLRTVIPPAVLPELHVSTYEGVQGDVDGAPLPGSFTIQARAVGAATAAVASRLATESRSVILEGVHLFPGAMRRILSTQKPGPVVVELLLTLGNVDRHRVHLMRRRRREPGRNGDRHLTHLQVIRTLQDHLRSLARESGVAEYDIEHPEDLTQTIVDQVVREIGLRDGLSKDRP